MNYWVIPPLFLIVIFILVITAYRMVSWSRSIQNILGALGLLFTAVVLAASNFQFVIQNDDATLLFNSLQTVGDNLIFVFWFLFLFVFIGGWRLFHPIVIGIFVLIFITPAVLAVIPSTEQWVYQSRSIIEINEIRHVYLQVGIIGIINILSTIVIGGTNVIWMSLLVVKKYSKHQSLLLILTISPVLPILGIIVDYYLLSPLYPYPSLIIIQALTALLICWIINKLRIGEDQLKMREQVIENMVDAIFILNAQKRLTFANTRGRFLISIPDKLVYKPHILDLLPELSSCISQHDTLDHGSDHAANIIIRNDSAYLPSISNYYDWKDELVGHILILHNVTDIEKMSKQLKENVGDLSRATKIYQALSSVAAKVANSSNIEHIYTTLTEELAKINLNYMIAIKDPNELGYTIEYTSLKSSLIQQFEKLTNFTITGFRIPDINELIEMGAENLEVGAYFPNTMIFTQKAYPLIQAFLQPAILSLINVTPLTSGFVLRIMITEEEYGIFGIWGERIQSTDSLIFYTFASQVSAAIQKAASYEKEHLYTKSLENTNQLITSLSRIASRFEARQSVDEVVHTVGTEIQKLGTNCLYLTIDPDTNDLVLRAIFGNKINLDRFEKLTNLNILGVRCPPSIWQKINTDPTTTPCVIDNAHQYALMILPKLSKNLLVKAFTHVEIFPDTSMIWLPLRTLDRHIGALMIWGVYRPQENLSAFTLFAQQTASAIEKARLHTELEQISLFNKEIVNGIVEAILIIEPTGIITFVNPAAEKFFETSNQNLIGKNCRALIAPHDISRAIETYRQLLPNGDCTLEMDVINSTGKITPVLVGVHSRGKVSHESILISIISIEQRKKSEQIILASMKEKETLLKEIHHRVKNNLQIISSLLSLQASRSQDHQHNEIFQESQNRIRSMALIHEKLYKSDSLAEIDMNEYVRELGTYLLRVYNDPKSPVAYEVDAEPLVLGIDSAIPCGLILTELISNSLKHSFRSATSRKSTVKNCIKVFLSQSEDQTIHLVVEDNGVGFPTDLETMKKSSLGLQLVSTLTEQLNGEVIFTNQDGAKVEISFPCVIS